MSTSTTGKPVKHKVDRNQEFTCVIGHPNGQCVATGCKDGKIYLWYNFLQEDKAVKSVLHWHSLPVRDLCYTQEGSYLLSGGHECVLVKWHHDSGYKDYLPRLGAPLNHIVCSSDNLLYATCYDDNVIQIVSSNFDIEMVYQGLTRGHHETRTRDPFPIGMAYDPKSQTLVLNGKPGHIQFYSVHEDKQLYNLDIVCQNYISPENLEKPLEITEVIQADFDSNGEWLATVEYWNDGVMTPEMRLKFWHFNEEKQSFVLNTSVEMPHEEKVHSLKFRPVSTTASSGMEHMAVTSSSDGKFKIWLLVDDTDIYRTNEKWICESVGFYRNLPAGEVAFSEDGSLLAVLFGSCITLWNPENNLFKETFQNTMYQDPVRHVMFGNHGSSHCLVSSTDKTLRVWSLISCTVLWSASTQIISLCKDPLTDVIAAFTNSNDLFVFRPSDPTPEFSHSGVSNSTVLSAAFVPHLKKRLYEKTTLSWQAHSELYFMNKDQELLAVSLEADTKLAKEKEDVVTFEQNLPQSALSLLMSHHSNKSKSLASSNRVTRQPDGKFMKEIFSSASHVQPSVNTLCRPFIQSLMIPSHERRQQQEEKDSDDEDLSEDEMTFGTHQTVSLDSGLDSDMEVDTQKSQSSVDKYSSQSQLDSDSDENDSAVLRRKKKVKREDEAVTSVCEKLDKVKVFEEKVTDKDLEKIFASDLSWYTSQLKT
ncbi:WD repeat-containing protein 75-like [Mercenaria mercenaria]|uniref:WD repeat-containing protein 75-like n=1 Tax=Mercenaria mercenaria TaxID=6596 RepID=UPI00234F5040|nr:WD repeat-containing protein 75-like [Mercenaria mercenaria]